MRTFTKRVQASEPTEWVVSLPYDRRQKSRLRATTTSGESVAIIVPRGATLRHGDCLEDDQGTLLRVEAAEETVSRARTEDPLLLTRAAYHLGNRHVPLQIDALCLSYRADHVLDAMVRELGLDVGVTQSRFEPESGAYAGRHSHSAEAESATDGANRHVHPPHSHAHDSLAPEDEEEEPDTVRNPRGAKAETP